MKKEIWHATGEAVRLSEEELGAALQSLPIYLEAALIECALVLANQEIRRREGGDGGPRGRSS